MRPLFERVASVRRPLARATATLRPPPGRRRDGAELLAELLDFSGAVELSRALATPATPERHAAPLAADEVLATARRRLARAEAEARRPIDDAKRDGLLTGGRIDAMLDKALARAPRRGAVSQAARDLVLPLETRVRERIVVVRRLVSDARVEIGPLVASSGAAGARLEQIDAALASATAKRTDALFARAAAALTDAFAAELERIALELPRPAKGEPLAPWADAARFAEAHVARCEALVLATFQHESNRIEMMLASVFGEATS